MKLRPLGDRVVIRCEMPAEEQIAGSLLFAPAKRFSFRHKGVVEAVGPGERIRLKNCERHASRYAESTRPMDLVVGEKVYFELGAGEVIEPDLIVCRENEVTASVNPVRPRNDNLFVRYETATPQAEGSLIALPENRRTEPYRGYVEAVGPGRLVPVDIDCGCQTTEWRHVRPQARPGDTVHFDLGTGTDFGQIFGPYRILEDRQISAIIEDGAEVVVLGDADPAALCARTRISNG